LTALAAVAFATLMFTTAPATDDSQTGFSEFLIGRRDTFDSSSMTVYVAEASGGQFAGCLRMATFNQNR